MFAAIAIFVAATSLVSGLQSDLQHSLAARARVEHISAVSLSIYVPVEPSNINVAVGHMQYGGAGAAITPNALYQIGSNTKSFTAATILQLEDEGVLSIDDTVGKWLPQYPAWKNITIRRLLNMTSDIPTYDDMESMLSAYARNPTKYFTTQELVGFVYPRIGLRSTYYVRNLYPQNITRRMVSGYFYSTDPDNNGLQPLYGKDMRNLSVSWAQGAGGIVSTPEDVTRWCHALYGGIVLKPKQQRELESLVSQETGKPIAETTSQQPRGFGLGVGTMLTKSAN